MAVRSRRLIDPVALGTTAPAPLYTAPVGAIVLVKNVRLVNITAEVQTFDVWIGPDPDTGCLFRRATCKPRGVISDSSWFVLEAGDELRALCDVDGALVLWASGAELQ